MEGITQRRSQHGTVDARARRVTCRNGRERAFFEHALVECILLHVFTDRTEAKGVSGWRVFRQGVARTKTGRIVSQHLDVRVGEGNGVRGVVTRSIAKARKSYIAYRISCCDYI